MFFKTLILSLAVLFSQDASGMDDSYPRDTVASKGRPAFAVSTNIPYDITWIPDYGLTSIPSVSLEFMPARGRLTFGTDVEWPMWQHPEDHRYMQVNNVTLWMRRYFRPAENKFKGTYLLANINAVRYGIGLGPDKGWQGEGAGVSLGIGRKMYLWDRVFIDAGAAFGFFYSGYDPYVWGNDATRRYYYEYFGNPDEFVRRNNRLAWFGPTRIYFSVGIDMFKRKR